MDKIRDIIKSMSEAVANNGNVVLEVIIGDNGALCHLIPEEIWREELEGEEEDEE